MGIILEGKTKKGEIFTQKIENDQYLIDLSAKDLAFINLEPLTRCSNLKTLNLNNNQLLYINLEPLANCSKLEKLDLDDSVICLWQGIDIPEKGNLSIGLQKYYTRLNLLNTLYKEGNDELSSISSNLSPKNMRMNIINRFMELLEESQKYNRLRKIGFFTIPILIGLYILKKANSKLILLEGEKDKIIENLVDSINESYSEIKNRYIEIIKKDTYLIYSEKDNYLFLIKEFINNLKYLSELINYLPSNIINLSIELIDKTNFLLDKTRKYNEEFIIRKRIEYADLFKKENLSLDDEQQKAIIIDDKHNLVIAGAGSGKTEVLTTRIAYLIKRKSDRVNPKRILALAFQTKAADEIKNRLKKRYNIDIEVRTFHSFGKKVIEDYADKKFIESKKLNDHCDDTYKYQKYIQRIFENSMKNDNILQNQIISFIKHYADDEVIKAETDFEVKEDYYKYQRSLTYTTLDGTIVKSDSERSIANFFITHNLNGKKINIEYEEPAKWMAYKDEEDKEHIPKPDFYFPDFDDIYLEHWAIDKEGNVPSWFSGEDATQKYQENMNIKKSKYNENNKVLIETTEAEFNEEAIDVLIERKFIEALQRKLPEEKFQLTSLSYYEIVEKVWNECREFVDYIPLNISRYITIAKTYGLNISDIEKRLNTGNWSPKQIAFARIALRIYKEYEQELEKEYSIDFSDMINLAAKYLDEEKLFYKNTYDQILIDEYQDISAQRFNLIKALMSKNPKCKLFCVGDDWQSIMGFAGSNLDYFIHFDKYFNHPAITNLSRNYRSRKSIVNVGSAIIKNNIGNQIDKQTIAASNEETPIVVYSSRHQKDYLEKYYEQIANHTMGKINEFVKKGYKYEDFMILLRIAKNPKLRKYLAKNNKFNIPISDNPNKPGFVHLLSVHRSKGLEAKVVILLNVDKGLYGFPCELENPDIFETTIKDNDGLREQEERRLFYVAVTRAKEHVIIYSQKCSESSFITEIEEYVLKEDLYY